MAYESLDDQLRADQLERGVILISGTIGLGTANVIFGEMMATSSRANKKLRIYLDSPGGAVHEALGVYDIIRGMVTQGVVVDIVGVGTVASAAVTVMQAASNRLTLPNTQFMLHEVSRMAPFLLEGTSELTESAKEVLRLQGLLYNIIADRTGMTMAELKKRVGRKVKWLSAQEAMDWNLIDGFTSVAL